MFSDKENNHNRQWLNNSLSTTEISNGEVIYSLYAQVNLKKTTLEVTKDFAI